MKKKQKEELKAKSNLELKNLVEDSKALISKFRIEKSQNKMKNLRAIFLERKKIALALTILNEKKKLEKIAKSQENQKVTKPKRSKK